MKFLRGAAGLHRGLHFCPFGPNPSHDVLRLSLDALEAPR
jgi:hypothetical protein